MTDFEQVLRTELQAHMGGATPEFDWAVSAFAANRRRHQRWAAAAVACLLLIFGVTIGGLVHEHGTSIRQGVEPAAQPSAGQTGAAGTALDIQGVSGLWNLSIRMTANPAAAICLDLRRIGITDRTGKPLPVDLCAPADPSYTSYHSAYVDDSNDQATIEFGRVPVGTTRVDVVGGSTVHAVLSQIPSTTIMVWAAETPKGPTAATATLTGGGQTINLLDHVKHGCQVLDQDDVETPASRPCPAAAPQSATTPTTPLGSGYASDETFCSSKGDLSYVVRNRTVTLTSTLTGLPANVQLLISWSNNAVRGYAIAAVQTGADGRFDGSTLNMFRPAEQHGIRMELTDGTNDSTLVLTLTSC